VKGEDLYSLRCATTVAFFVLYAQGALSDFFFVPEPGEEMSPPPSLRGVLPKTVT